MTKSNVSLVVPVFNEEDAIPVFLAEVEKRRKIWEFNVEVVFINDGSSDRTASVLEKSLKVHRGIKVINFLRNFGKEPALFAGIEAATGDAVIPIDVDLQDPIDIIPELVEKWRCGFDVVLAKRADRSSDSWLKRKTAEIFYRVHNSIAHSKIEENVGDFRLMDRSIVEAVKLLPERQLFMKGLLSWVGGNFAVVEYERQERIVGETKFNGWKLWNLALEGITSFSTVPLRIWSYIGTLVALFALAYSLWIIIDKIAFGNPVPGYTSLITAILFLGGVQLIGIGVLGEYIGRIYMETKGRPRYIIKDIKSSSQQ